MSYPSLRFYASRDCDILLVGTLTFDDFTTNDTVLAQLEDDDKATGVEVEVVGFHIFNAGSAPSLGSAREHMEIRNST